MLCAYDSKSVNLELARNVFQDGGIVMSGAPIPVIDLFAGPGGLGEGFSSLRDRHGRPVFKIIMSIEKEKKAHSTLRLRAFTRSIMRDDGSLPEEYLRYVAEPTKEHLKILQDAFPDEWKSADHEAVQGELKINDDGLVEEADQRLQAYYAENGQTGFVLIGGPPCQAYSLVGRARRTKHKEELEKDEKQTLYKCYLRFIEKLKPTAFVMENVKGLLSARHYGEGVFGHIRHDMLDAGYTLHSLKTTKPGSPHDFLICANDYGIPQARHRVILLGTRNDVQRAIPEVLRPKSPVSVRQAIGKLPKLRSGFSLRVHEPLDWSVYVREAAQKILNDAHGELLREELKAVRKGNLPARQSAGYVNAEPDNPLVCWYRAHLDNRLLTEHESRNHMASDLDRYLFCAAFAKHNMRTATLYDFPEYLLPNHKNAEAVARGRDVIFADRFRVQMPDGPSTTITSHISKDGHYYIHYDPVQCRSLTVREAARLQTFPDDYFFEGNRTDQYRQVGNAVPPLLANQIAGVVSRWMGIPAVDWFDDQNDRSLSMS